MVSTEVLRRYPFFAFMSPAQLRQVAMLTDEVELAANEALFTLGQPADALYLLRQGSIDLHYVVVDEHMPSLRKDFMVGTINPGEVLGISAVINPPTVTATAIASEPCVLLRIDGAKLQALCQEDTALALGLYKQMALAAMERLQATRTLLAAASAPVWE